ncbi:MAG: UDP-N-acetylmuramoyl-L-alanine--D-glutamate ligase [Gemmatimonadetes bacterium]|nr:UDP-N-acetylmuramoyl-L-alanine--D-glutamate ligase [Gemmatimonadota bacterium]
MAAARGAALFEPGDPVAVLGLGISGSAAARLAHSLGAEVYASDAFEGPVQRDAVDRLVAEGIDAEAGGHDLDRILASRTVITSPGIPPTAEIRRAVSDAALPTVAEIELAFRHLRSRVIGITGTNGKTTTTALCGHLLETAGLDAVTAGNIGLPLSEVALLEDQPEWAVVELSSFQLADLESFHPAIGVLLNLAPDHLDRYPSLDRYYEDKARLFANAVEGSRWVINADDADVMAMARDVVGEKYRVSIEPHDGVGAFLDGDELVQRLDEDGAPVAWTRVDDLRLVGRHNVLNALLAGLAAALAGCDPVSIAAGLSSFEGLPHRLQRIGEYDGVLWINDSKGTNVSATKVALSAFRRPLVALLGGRHKGEPYTSLIGPLEENARAVIAFGEAAPKIVREIGDAVPLQVASGIEQLVRIAREHAEEGDVVLFSPACSSYDMFPNYEERGQMFARCVRSAHGVESTDEVEA